MSNSLKILFNRLGLNKDNGLYIFENKDKWKHLFPFRISRAIEKIKPYAFYAVKNENNTIPLILFIDNTNNVDLEKLHPKLWNFQIPVIIIDNGNEWQIHTGCFLHNNRLEDLIKPINHKTLNKNDKSDIDIFSFLNIVSGNTWKKFYEKLIEKGKRKKLDTYLLENINETINILTKGEHAIKSKKNREIATNLIGRLIFIRYLIDRKVELGFKNIKDNNSRNDFENLILHKEELYELFEYLKSKDKFNGNLFPFVDNEKNLIQKNHLQILYELFQGRNLQNREQLDFISLFDIYDFNIIPVELISNIYERFIGKEEQQITKSFYTPPFLVDYILKYTIESHLENNVNCKVLDPSCGSGIFLVETLRKIIEKNISTGYLRTYDDLKQISANDNQLKQIVKENDKKLRNIVKDNIFGIDKDPKAINVAIFSIYITILDYKEPKEIENFKLPMLDNNFIAENFFDKQIEKIYKNQTFDFIIGNPPWGSVTTDDKHNEYVKDNEDKISDFQIAQSFVVRTKDFCDKNTNCALIITSKILYNSGAKKFRDFFIKDYQLQRVLELSAVRKQIFTKAIGPAAILFFKYLPGQVDSNKVVHHISLKPNRFFKLFKIIVIEKHDYKKIPQKLFKDWVWKVLLYGNRFDYEFFNYYFNSDNIINLEDFLKKQSIFFGAGFIIGKEDRKADATELRPHKVVKCDNFANFFIAANLNKFEKEYPNIEKVKDKGRLTAYNDPHLLIKRGIYKKSVVAFSDFYCLFPNSVYGLHSTEENITTLKSLGALFSTSLFSYFMFFKSSQWGVERDEVYKQDYEETPIIQLSNEKTENILKEFDNATKLAKEKFNNPFDKRPDYSFDKIFYEIYNIDQEEQALIDYTLNISIPLFRQKESPFRLIHKSESESEINEYINVFFKFYKDRFQKLGKCFKADVYFHENEYIIVDFLIVDNKPEKLIEYFNNSKKFAFYTEIFSVPEVITNEIFIQKDLKRIKENSFFVIKPNEYKNWHPAIAYLDVYEFYDALMKAGKNKIMEGRKDV